MASTQKKKITGPGVLGGVSSLGAVTSKMSQKGLISAIVNQTQITTPPNQLTTKINRSFFNPTLGSTSGGYDLRNASISPSAIEKALANPDQPTNAAPPPPKPTFDFYTDEDYEFMGYFD
jgi:hypothetical protein